VPQRPQQKGLRQIALEGTFRLRRNASLDCDADPNLSKPSVEEKGAQHLSIAESAYCSHPGRYGKTHPALNGICHSRLYGFC
jgi:hypothetical protein